MGQQLAVELHQDEKAGEESHFGVKYDPVASTGKKL